MDLSVLVARHFARLVHLLRHAPEQVDDQKGALRAIVTALRDAPVQLRAEEGRLLANGTPLPDILQGVQEVADALGGALSLAVSFAQQAAPGDTLALARLIATESGSALHERLEQLGLATVTVEQLEADAPPARTRATAQLNAELLAEIDAEQQRARAASAQAAAEALRQAEAAAAGLTGDATLDAVLVRAALTRDPKGLERSLEEFANRVEQAVRTGERALGLRAIAVLIAREQEVPSESRRSYFITLRRLFRLSTLRVLLPLHREGGESAAMVERIVRRAGDDGVAALFGEIERAESVAVRQAFGRILRVFPDPLALVQRIMQDTRWHVVRTVADLLGEQVFPEGDRLLADLLGHPDDRVRRAAVSAVARYTTPFAVDVLRRALSDPAATVRRQAVDGLAARRRESQAVNAVVSAVEREEDIEVQLAMVQALGRFGTTEAVNTLTRAAAPDGRLFRRKSPAYRVTAVIALADAATPAALGMLGELAQDRDREVRDAADRALRTVGSVNTR